jgi:putative ABC transport system permease protein
VTYAERIRKIDGVAAVTWANWFAGIYRDEKHFFAQFAVDAPSYFSLYPEFVLSDREKAAFQHDLRGVVVGRKLARENGWKIGDAIPLKGTLYPGTWTFTIDGIYRGEDKSTDEKQFIFHWDYLNETIKTVLPSLADRVGIFIVYLKHPSDSANVSAAIDSTFRNSLAETRTETQKAYQLGFIAMVDTILVAIQAVAYVVVLIIMAVMANTMAMTARERTVEYATLKALGFPNSFVFALIAGESLSIAVLGGAIGIALTFPLAQQFFHATERLFAVFEVTSTTLVLQGCAAVLIGLVAAAAPAIYSARIRIVDGLRAVA